MEEGNIMLLLDEKGLRDLFPIERVVKIFKGPDSGVISAELRPSIKIKLNKGQRNMAQKLYWYIHPLSKQRKIDSLRS